MSNNILNMVNNSLGHKMHKEISNNKIKRKMHPNKHAPIIGYEIEISLLCANTKNL